MKIHVLRHADFKRIIFGMSSFCLSVCLSVGLSVCVSVCGHHNSKDNWASSTKFGMRSYMIKISVGIAYEQNRTTGVASALRAQFGFWAKSALKMHCTKIVSQTKVVTNHNTQLLSQKRFWSPNGCGLCPDSTIRFFGEKCLKSALYKIFLPDKSCYKSISATFMLCNIFDILHHYGVIAASQICSVSRKYCAVLRNRFFFIMRDLFISF